MLLAVACFLVPYFTTSFALGVLCMLLALVLLVAAVMLLLSARIGDATRGTNILSVEELRVLREQAQAERQRAAGVPSDHANAIPDASSATANRSSPPSTPG